MPIDLNQLETDASRDVHAGLVTNYPLSDSDDLRGLADIIAKAAVAAARHIEQHAETDPSGERIT